MATRQLRVRAYFLVWSGMLVLTGLTFALSFARLGSLDIVAALSIASIKAALVAAFFMHLYERPGATRLVPLVSCLFVVLLVALTVADVMTRDGPGAWPPDQGSLLPSNAAGR